MSLSRRLLRQRQNLGSLKTEYDNHKEKIALLLAKLVFKCVDGTVTRFVYSRSFLAGLLIGQSRKQDD